MTALGKSGAVQWKVPESFFSTHDPQSSSLRPPARHAESQAEPLTCHIRINTSAISRDAGCTLKFKSQLERLPTSVQYIPAVQSPLGRLQEQPLPT